MPWKVQGNCVHKENSDGSLGEMVKCFDGEGAHEMAMQHMKALYANAGPEAREAFGLEPAAALDVPKLRIADIHELIDLSEAVLHEDRKAVDVTLIAAGWSKNRRYYPASVLEASAPKWEGVKAYADHPTKAQQKDRPERSVLDAAGVYENTRYHDGKVRATLRLIGEVGEKLWPWVVESVQSKTRPIGLSINALGQARKGEMDGQSGFIIEAITHANSVDIVTEPAAGGAFERLLASDDGWTTAVLAGMTLDELREARPDLLDSLKREWKTTRDSQAIQDARAQTAQAKTRVQQLDEQYRASQQALAKALEQVQALHREQLVDRLLDNDKLPQAIRRELREKLLAADGMEAMQATLNNAIALLGAVRLPVRVTGAGRSASPLPDTPAVRPVNLVAAALGIDPALATAQTFEEFQEAKQKAQGV